MPETIGERFCREHIWGDPDSERCYILFSDAAVGAWVGSMTGGINEAANPVLIAFPKPSGGTHYGLRVRSRFVETIRGLDDYSRIAHLLNQIIPWTVIEVMAPEVYGAWKSKMEKKEAATAECHRNHLAKLDKKAVRNLTSNKSVSRFAREQRKLQG